MKYVHVKLGDSYHPNVCNSMITAQIRASHFCIQGFKSRHNFPGNYDPPLQRIVMSELSNHDM